MAESPDTSPMLVRPASRVTPCDYQWLWRDRFALGKLSILDGDPGLGKSLLGLDLCARLSTGRPMPDDSPGPEAAPALFINGEDNSEDTSVPRLQALGADLERVYVLEAAHDMEQLFRLPSQVGLLDDALSRTRARLVVIDPLMAFLDPSVHVMNDQSVRRALAPVKRLAERHGCAVLFIRHLNKALRTRALYRGVASIAFTGVCRSSWLVGRDPQQPERVVFAQIKNNPVAAQPSLAYQITRGEGPQPSLTWLGISSYTADAVLTPPRLSSSAARTLRAAEFLKAFLATGPKPSSEIWKAAQKEGFSRRTLQRAMQRSGIRSKRVQDNNVPRAYWLLEGQKLPPELADPHGLQALIAPMREQFPEPTPIDDL